MIDDIVKQMKLSRKLKAAAKKGRKMMPVTPSSQAKYPELNNAPPGVKSMVCKRKL